jgi:hypothetical protein
MPTREGDRDTGARWGHRPHPGVPARVCDNCGEEYLDETTTAELLKTANAAAQAGVDRVRSATRGSCDHRQSSLPKMLGRHVTARPSGYLKSRPPKMFGTDSTRPPSGSR